jgi:antitoxin component YwqK of YwqJK toxin-antitoxin module
MLEKKQYTNGQKVYDLTKEKLQYYYKNGNLKAEGPFQNSEMNGEWRFYRESGQLWQVGSFRNNQKHGEFIKYDKEDQVESIENFVDGKKVKS